jgi:hypothetical protein
MTKERGGWHDDSLAEGRVELSPLPDVLQRLSPMIRQEERWMERKMTQKVR